ncbi:MAG: hypothetical protein ACE5MI_08325 [Acidimicrobiia bacterium]
MDIIDRHFAAENAHDVEATLATYADDIIWDDITHPDSPFHGKRPPPTCTGAAWRPYRT